MKTTTYEEAIDILHPDATAFVIAEYYIMIVGVNCLHYEQGHKYSEILLGLFA